MRCFRCNRKSLFLRVNDEGLCSDCVNEMVREADRRRKEEEDRKRVLEQKEHEENVAYYENVCTIYRSLPEGYFYDVDSPLYMQSISSKTIGQLLEMQEPHKILVEELQKRHKYRYFNDLFLKDIVKVPEKYGNTFKHRCFPTTRHTYGHSVDIDVASEVDRLIEYSQKAIAAYRKAIDIIESAATELFAGNDGIKESLRMEHAYHNVAGIGFYEKNLLKLAGSSPYYPMTKAVLVDYVEADVDIWKNNFEIYRVELIPEPDNPHDANAIMVVADGVHIGYIEAVKCAETLKLIQEHKIVRMTCEITGGAYKRIREDFDLERDKVSYYLERGTKPYKATIAMTSVDWD